MNNILRIPSDKTVIVSDEYIGNLEITEIHFEKPSILEKIEDRAFANCTNLKKSYQYTFISQSTRKWFIS